MPKNAINYSHTIIYKLCCKDPTIIDIYIGHTTDFNNRKRLHKTTCNNSNDKKKYNFNIYQFIRKNGGFENWDMIQIEAYPCKDRREAETRERYWIENLKSSLNKIIPTRTRKEYYEQNKEKHKNYYEQNKEQIAEYNKNYYEINKEQFAEKYKNYYEQNKEQIAEKAKNYYEQKKEKYKEYREKHKKEKMTCECGSIFNLSGKSNHNKSIKHQDYLNSINSSVKILW
jgi:vacuolar-type H+-ATPase subunit I/STV1